MIEEETMPHKNEQSFAQEQGTNKTILVVEDDTSIGEFLVQLLVQETPYRALLVTDGFQALDIIRNIKPDLLILDYRLQKMTGVDLYDRLHTMTGLEHIPGIIISANLPKDELQKRTLVGISKPFELSDLLGTVDKLLA
jgi:CheY-like chemotaxis protein